MGSAGGWRVSLMDAGVCDSDQSIGRCRVHLETQTFVFLALSFWLDTTAFFLPAYNAISLRVWYVLTFTMAGTDPHAPFAVVRFE